MIAQDANHAPEPTQRSIAEGFHGYVLAVALVAASTALGMWIAPRWGTAAVDLIYLPAVLAAAALAGLGPGLMAGILSALAYIIFSRRRSTHSASIASPMS